MALVSLVHPRHRLDLVADLAVRGQIGRAEPVLDPKLPCGLTLGGEVLGLGALVHELGGKEGDLPPDAFVSHGRKVRRLAHRCGAGQTRPGWGLVPETTGRDRDWESHH